MQACTARQWMPPVSSSEPEAKSGEA
jgi:hypothetical protein